MGGASAFKEPSPSNARGRSGGSLAKNSAPPSVQDAAPKVETLNLVDTVNPKDRINAQQSIDYMKELLACEKRVEEPTDDIQEIFNKITAWKQKAGDLD